MQFVNEQHTVFRDNNMKLRGGRKRAFIDLKRLVLISVITDKTNILQPPGGVRSGGRKAQRCTQRCWALAPNNYHISSYKSDMYTFPRPHNLGVILIFLVDTQSRIYILNIFIYLAVCGLSCSMQHLVP